MKKGQRIFGVIIIGILLTLGAVLVKLPKARAESEIAILPGFPRDQQPYVLKQKYECRLEVAKKKAECNKKENQAEMSKCLFEVTKKARQCGIPFP